MHANWAPDSSPLHNAMLEYPPIATFGETLDHILEERNRAKIASIVRRLQWNHALIDAEWRRNQRRTQRLESDLVAAQETLCILFFLHFLFAVAWVLWRFAGSSKKAGAKDGLEEEAALGVAGEGEKADRLQDVLPTPTHIIHRYHIYQPDMFEYPSTLKIGDDVLDQVIEERNMGARVASLFEELSMHHLRIGQEYRRTQVAMREMQAKYDANVMMQSLGLGALFGVVVIVGSC
ncbi:hypothetical protein OF83DRAFT_1288683 [Amylostereum chailletii]|nr:hypothetical protein OF83DRAFT_1288683 [Amylostereum chailletii]